MAIAVRTSGKVNPCSLLGKTTLPNLDKSVPLLLIYPYFSARQ
jgi:hypothetical protein